MKCQQRIEILTGRLDLLIPLGLPGSGLRHLPKRYLETAGDAIQFPTECRNL